MKQVTSNKLNFLDLDLIKRSVRAAEDTVSRAEFALAIAVLDMAEASCKGTPKPESCVKVLRLAYDAALENLNNIKAVMQSLEGRKEVNNDISVNNHKVK